MNNDGNGRQAKMPGKPGQKRMHRLGPLMLRCDETSRMSTQSDLLSLVCMHSRCVEMHGMLIPLE